MFKKFLKDSRANVLTTVALSTPIMLMSAGAGLDMAELYRANTSFQSAVDAAALASAKVLSKTGDESEAVDFGKKVFEANIANLSNSTYQINIDTGNGDCSGEGVVVEASMRHPMLFDKLHKAFTEKGDAGYANVSAKSTVQCGSDSVEIALVLDNSGSMRHSGKMSTLKTAARKLVDTVHSSMGQSGKPKPVQFSVVPFSGMVNVGNQFSNASWMDTDGRSSVHNEHFDWTTLKGATKVGGVWRDENGQKLTRFRLYDELGITWAGCVEQRPYPHHTTDAAPTISSPDTMFVPTFAPDAPDDYSGERETTQNSAEEGVQHWCVRWRYSRRRGWRCRTWNDGYRGSRHPVAGYANLYGGDYNSRGQFIGVASTLVYGDRIREEEYDNDYLRDAHNMPEPRDANFVGHRYDPAHVGSGAKQYSRQRWMWKYFNHSQRVSNFPTVGWVPGGPNAWCTVEPLTALTTSKGRVYNAINDMNAYGSTNIQQGISWGWRTLTAGAPFSEGRPSSVTDNKKIMIIMTDGNNTMYPHDYFDDDRSSRNPSHYSPMGFNGGEYGDKPLPKRLFEGFDAIANPTDDRDTYQKAMDEHMVETCNNAKADGLQVYTVAFDVSNGSSVKARLSECASKDAAGLPLYFDADDNAELLKSFEAIADKIAELSITN